MLKQKDLVLKVILLQCFLEHEWKVQMHGLYQCNRMKQHFQNRFYKNEVISKSRMTENLLTPCDSTIKHHSITCKTVSIRPCRAMSKMCWKHSSLRDVWRCKHKIPAPLESTNDQTYCWNLGRDNFTFFKSPQYNLTIWTNFHEGENSNICVLKITSLIEKSFSILCHIIISDKKNMEVYHKIINITPLFF